MNLEKIYLKYEKELLGYEKAKQERKKALLEYEEHKKMENKWEKAMLEYEIAYLECEETLQECEKILQERIKILQKYENTPQEERIYREKLGQEYEKVLQKYEKAKDDDEKAYQKFEKIYQEHKKPLQEYDRAYQEQEEKYKTLFLNIKKAIITVFTVWLIWTMLVFFGHYPWMTSELVNTYISYIFIGSISLPCSYFLYKWIKINKEFNNAVKTLGAPGSDIIDTGKELNYVSVFFGVCYMWALLGYYIWSPVDIILIFFFICLLLFLPLFAYINNKAKVTYKSEVKFGHYFFLFCAALTIFMLSGYYFWYPSLIIFACIFICVFFLLPILIYMNNKTGGKYERKVILVDGIATFCFLLVFVLGLIALGSSFMWLFEYVFSMSISFEYSLPPLLYIYLGLGVIYAYILIYISYIREMERKKGE